MPATAGLAERNNGAKASGGSASGKTEGRPAGSALERVTVNLTLRSARALELATQLTGDSKTDVLNRAIQIYAYLEYAISQGGSVHVQESADSQLELVKFF
jgi:hypothetical protein